MGFVKSKLESATVSAKAATVVVAARTHNAKERWSEQKTQAAEMVKQDKTIKGVLSEQERRDNAVLEAANDVERIDARIARLEERRVEAVKVLRDAQALADDVTSLPVGG